MLMSVQVADLERAIQLRDLDIQMFERRVSVSSAVFRDRFI